MILRERSLKSCAWPSYIERSHSVIQSKPAPPKIPSMHFAELVPQMMSKNSLFFLSSPPSWRDLIISSFARKKTMCVDGEPVLRVWVGGLVLRQTRRLCPIMWFACKSLVCMMDSLVIQIHAWLLAQGTRDVWLFRIGLLVEKAVWRMKAGHLVPFAMTQQQKQLENRQSSLCNFQTATTDHIGLSTPKILVCPTLPQCPAQMTPIQTEI